MYTLLVIGFTSLLAGGSLFGIIAILLAIAAMVALVGGISILFSNTGESRLGAVLLVMGVILACGGLFTVIVA